MKQGITFIGAALIAMTASTAAQAQTAGTVPIRVTFTGTVSSGPQDSVMIRQSDGSYAPYSGVTPAYSYQNGDAVSISFNTVMPTSQFFSANPQYATADGIYRYPVNMNPSGLPFGDINRNGIDISGPMYLGAGANYSTVTGMTMVFDSNTGQYSLEFPTGNWGISAVDGPSYTYDVANNSLTPAGSACIYNCSMGDGGVGTRGTDTTASYRGTVVSGSGQNQSAAGFWDMVWNGSWNLPTYGSGATSGGATPVPEPSVIVLFGSAAAGLMFARRRKRKAA